MVTIEVTPTVQVMLDGDLVATNLTRLQQVSLNVGKDSVRSLNPAKSPILTVQLYADGAMFHTRQYAEGLSIWLSAQPTGKSQALWFTGILDEPEYTLVPGGRTRVDLRAFGFSSKLRGTIVNVPIQADVSISDAIVEVLDAAGWPIDKRDISSTGLTATIPFWWVQEQSAWEALEELVNAAGPPAQMYEDASGNLVVLGTTWVGADTTAPIRVGAGQEQPRNRSERPRRHGCGRRGESGCDPTSHVQPGGHRWSLGVRRGDHRYGRFHYTHIRRVLRPDLRVGGAHGGHRLHAGHRRRCYVRVGGFNRVQPPQSR